MGGFEDFMDNFKKYISNVISWEQENDIKKFPGSMKITDDDLLMMITQINKVKQEAKAINSDLEVKKSELELLNKKMFNHVRKLNPGFSEKYERQGVRKSGNDWYIVGWNDED